MATFYGMLKLGKPEDWERLAGEGKWVKTRSAYELAYAWHGANGIPAGVKSAFDQSGISELSGLNLEIAFVEKPSFLDTPIGPSMTDTMGYARNRNKDPVILAVEGKATESFGLPVNIWVRGGGQAPDPVPSRIRRLQFWPTASA